VILVLVLGLERDQQIAGEERVPGVLGDDPHRHPVFRVGAYIAVLDKEFLVLEEGLDPPVQGLEELRIVGPVVLAPPDLVLGGVLADDVLLLSGPGRPLAGVDHEGATVGHKALVAEDRLLIEGRRRKIPVHTVDMGETVVIQAESAFEILGLGRGGGGELQVFAHVQSLTSLRSPM